AANATGRRDGAGDEAHAVERGADTVIGESLPTGVPGDEISLSPDQQARFLIGLAYRGKSNGPHACRRHPASGPGYPCPVLGMEIPRDSHAAVIRVRAAPGKYEFS